MVCSAVIDQLVHSRVYPSLRPQVPFEQKTD